MDENYKFYVDCCKSGNCLVKPLIEYHKDKHGHRIGVVLAYKQGDSIYVGASLCHSKEKNGFNKDIGINKAMRSAVPIDKLSTPTMSLHGWRRCSTAWNSIPESMEKPVKRMIERAYKYFKDIPVKPVNEEGLTEVPDDCIAKLRNVPFLSDEPG